MERTIVEYFGINGGHKCGYCGSERTSISHGMWAHCLTCKDYEDLLNRGWRRSGKYVYKPLLDATCCTLYTIRCDVSNFKLTKSQKKILKKMKKFLLFGRESTTSKEEETAIKQGASKHVVHVQGQRDGNANKRKNSPKSIEDHIEDFSDVASMLHRLEVKICRVDLSNVEFKKHFEESFELFCKYQKAIHNDPKEKLNVNRVKTVRSHPQSHEFLESFQSEYELFLKYQMAIHKEKKSENPVSQFKRFLVDCPLTAEEAVPGLPSTGLGAFHQQYFLDGKLIAVGVIDVLPHCLSSKYFFYDPEYDFLSLGTYSALREIHFVRNLMKSCPDFRYYYIGFYLHSCQKMRYKGNYDPSFLLCPESFKFQPIKSCIESHDLTKYCRLNPLDEADTYPDEGKALVLHEGQMMPFSLYLEVFSSSDEKKRRYTDEVREYCKLVGNAAERMLLYRE